MKPEDALHIVANEDYYEGGIFVFFNPSSYYFITGMSGEDIGQEGGKTKRRKKHKGQAKAQAEKAGAESGSLTGKATRLLKINF